eukprot:15955968-Heterocapsa_arctica.AAC.1
MHRQLAGHWLRSRPPGRRSRSSCRGPLRDDGSCDTIGSPPSESRPSRTSARLPRKTTRPRDRSRRTS